MVTSNNIDTFKNVQVTILKTVHIAKKKKITMQNVAYRERDEIKQT